LKKPFCGVGGFYFLIRYPDIVDIALAASAPILLYDGITSSDAFFNVAQQTIAGVDARCPDIIRDGLLDKTVYCKAHITTRKL
jgi:hypothetical protein